MEESALDEDTVPIFKLSDLIKLHTERLRQLGVEVVVELTPQDLSTYKWKRSPFD